MSQKGFFLNYINIFLWCTFIICGITFKSFKTSINWMWWLTTTAPAFKRRRRVILDYIVSFRPTWATYEAISENDLGLGLVAQMAECFPRNIGSWVREPVFHEFAFMNVCNPSIWEVVTGGAQVQGHLGLRRPAWARGEMKSPIKVKLAHGFTYSPLPTHGRALRSWYTHCG